MCREMGNVMSIQPYILESTFDHFVAESAGRLPTDLTFARLKRIRQALLLSKEYSAELQRHGLGDKSVYKLRDTDQFAYNHLRGNFWSMCLDAWFAAQREKMQ